MIVGNVALVVTHELLMRAQARSDLGSRIPTGGEITPSATERLEAPSLLTESESSSPA